MSSWQKLKKLGILCLIPILISMCFPINSNFVETSNNYVDFSSFQEREDYHVDHSEFWNVFKPQISWNLKCNDDWHPLNVSEEYLNYSQMCKYTLSFFASISGNYTIGFIIDVPLEELEAEDEKVKMKYKDEMNDVEWESEFNWADMVNLTEYDFSFEQKTNETGFYFWAAAFISGNMDVVIDPYYEDFTKYEEYDPYNHIEIVNATYIYANVGIAEDSYVYRDMNQTDFFTNFTHQVSARAESHYGNCEVAVWLVSETVNDVRYARIEGYAQLYAMIHWHVDFGSTYRLILYETYDYVRYQLDYCEIVENVTYYLTTTKLGTYAECKVYNDSAKTSLVDTLNGTLQADHSFRYVYGICTQDDVTGGRNIEVHIMNLDLGMIPNIVTFYHNVGGILRLNNITISNATQIMYDVETDVELVSVPENSSYVFLNFMFLTFNKTEKLIDSYTYQGITQMWRYERQHPTNESETESAGGQAIKVNQTFRLHKIAFKMGREDGGNGTIRCYVYLMNETRTYGENAIPTGDPIAISEPLDLIEEFPEEMSWAYKNFTFEGNNQITILENHCYCFTGIFEIRISGTWNINHQTNGEHSGNWYAWTGNDGGRWGYISGDYDQNFYLYGYPLIMQNESSTNPYNYAIDSHVTIWCYFSEVRAQYLEWGIVALLIMIPVCLVAVLILRKR